MIITQDDYLVWMLFMILLLWLLRALKENDY